MSEHRKLLFFMSCLLFAFMLSIVNEAKALATISNNLSMDGQIYGAEVETLPIFPAKRKEFLADDLFDALGINVTSGWSKETVQRKYGVRTVFSEAGTGTFCILEPGRIYHSTEDFLRYENILEFYLNYGRIPNAGPLESNRWEISRNPVEDKKYDKSLPFMKADEAVKMCLNVLSTIGTYGAPVLLDFHAFSGQELAENHARMLQSSPEYVAFVSLGVKDTTALINSPKDIYCLMFGFTHYKVWTFGALEQAASMPDGTNFALPQSALFYLSTDGFMKVELKNIMEPISSGENVKILSYEDTLAIASNVLANDPSHTFLIREVYLSYLPIDKMNGQVEFRPYWNFFLTYGLESDDGTPSTWSRVLRIDAHSGQVIW